MTHHPTHIHRCYLASNIFLNLFYILTVVTIVAIPEVNNVVLIILIALQCSVYILYLIVAYSCTQLLFLIGLKPFEEY